MHWCMPMIDYEKMEVVGPSVAKVWEKMEGLVDKGLVRSIGVCNCNVMTLMNLMADARIKPSVVQVELHPYMQQEGLVNTCQRFGIQVTAMAPLGASGFPYFNYEKTKIVEHPVLKEIAEKHGATIAQVALAWNLNRNVSVIPKSSNNERIKENFGAYEVTLDQDDLDKIKDMNENYRIFDPGMWIEPESGWFNLSDFD